MSLKNSNIYTIDKYLKDNYFIPNYQREYSWEDTELIDFWDDLEALITTEDEDARHFFGQIVIHDDNHDKKKYIIDGQQRTITSIIFLRTLQLAFKNIDREYSLETANQYNANITALYIHGLHGYNLVLGNIDNDYFRENIQEGTPDSCRSDKIKSHERLRKAFQFFANKIQEKMDAAGSSGVDKMNVLKKYFDAFTNHFEVLCMEATELSEAFIIFETLNARGKDLETADLLKNFIFSKSNDINSAQTRWQDMLDNLDKADTTKFIRHYWNSCHAFTRDKELYKRIVKEASSPKENADLLLDLEKLAPYYHDLVYPTDDLNAFKDEKLCEKLATLKTLKASTYYPVILAMLNTDGLKNEKQINEVLHHIVLYVFRNFTICNKVANTAEVFLAKTAKHIYDQEYTTVKDITDVIDKEIVNDEEFYASFCDWTASNSTKDIARYILRQIHYYLDDYKELNLNNMDVHIEHIMPQDNSKWNMNEEEHETYLWKLGNLALLSGPKNISISNDPFEIKKEVYAKSEISPNKDISEYETWGVDQIKDRQTKLADIAKKIWRK